jgi:predicted acetyltransferase
MYVDQSQEIPCELPPQQWIQKKMTKTPSYEIRRAEAEDATLINNMLELYQYELSDIWDQDLDSSGRYGYDLDRFLRGKSRFAYLLTVQGAPAGFALVGTRPITKEFGYWMDQFFVMKKYRRRRLASEFAAAVIAEHPGDWEIGAMVGNERALAFWRQFVKTELAVDADEVRLETGWWQGVIQSFTT